MTALTFDVIIIGAGAAGLMSAIEAGKRQRKVLLLDHANKPGKKILMSGGGRCNFTNNEILPERYLSQNPHFAKSALKRYTQWDFINLVESYKIPYHEKTLGQLFCDNKAKDILNMLLAECEKAKVTLTINRVIKKIDKVEGAFKIQTKEQLYSCQSLIIATGGLSIPTLGATPFGYQIAEQFGLTVLPTRAGLVPFTLDKTDKEKLSPLSGVSLPCTVETQQQQFQESLLFTHRGLSGPAMLQISSYWQPGQALFIDLLPKIDLLEKLKQFRQKSSNLLLKNMLSELMPKRIIACLLDEAYLNRTLTSFSNIELDKITTQLKTWAIKPCGTEGYRTAEVTLGGVSCHEVSSKTMESLKVPGLYFIGEVLDVTGWLGGYNFQWAWSSGWAAGQVA